MRRHVRLLGGWSAAIGLAAGVPWGLQAISREAPQLQAPPSAQIASLSEPGEGLTIRHTSEETGFVTFASSEGQGILVSVQANAPTETRARSFIGLYGAAFGITDQSQLRLARTPEIDALGIEHVRFQQQHQGIPVTAGDLVVHLRGSRITAVNGHTSRDLPVDVTPDVAPGRAIVAARELVAKHRPGRDVVQVLAPELVIFDRNLLEPGGTFPVRLAWFVEARGPALREYIWVDAEFGGILLNFNQIADARNRIIYDANNGATLPGSVIRVENGPATGIPDADNAYTHSGTTYDYFFSTHGRDSYDGAGATLHSTVNWDDGGTCPNAFWNGTQMVYCDGFSSADDVVAHELTHAVTERTAGLFYYYQSGALNESFSDVFGESVDLINGDEGERWYLAEDLPIGAIRHMMNPNLFGDPARVGDPVFWCSAADSGGVHINSGVPNHAYALMVDGGTYNGRTVTGIGRLKADQIQYRALALYLTSGSTFLDNFNALNQSCTDLTGFFGITASDCTQVRSAVEAVEMDDRWNCAAATAPVPLCASGAPPTSTTFLDTFEGGIGSWTVANPLGADQWAWFTGVAKTGSFHAGAFDVGTTSDQRFTHTAGVVVPAGGRMAFDHLFDFEISGATNFDGGVLEYSTDGVNYVDAAPLIDGGQAYNGGIANGFGNPLAGRSAFVRVSFGYVNTRLNLASLAGQTVRFRFRLGSDPSVGAFGWFVDNVQIYSCAGAVNGEMIQNGTFASGGTPPATPPANWKIFSLPTSNDIVWNTVGGTFNFYRPPGSTQAVVFQETGVPVPAFGALEARFTMANTDVVRKRFSVLIHDQNFSDLSVCTFWLDPLASTSTYVMRTHTTKSWANATISVYAATVGSGGFYQLDNVSMKFVPAQSHERTDCLDPVSPGPGGSGGGDLMANGTFSGGVITPWSTFGNIQSQLTGGGVFEFFKLAGLPSGVVLQTLNPVQAMVDNQKLLATFQIGNSSALRQRVTVLLHASDFSDLHACTFFLPPGLPLSAFSMRTYTTKAWTNTTVSVYPATVGTAPSHQWLRLDNVTLVRTTSATTGTECFEPGDIASFAPSAR